MLFLVVLRIADFFGELRIYSFCIILGIRKLSEYKLYTNLHILQIFLKTEEMLKFMVMQSRKNLIYLHSLDFIGSYWDKVHLFVMFWIIRNWFHSYILPIKHKLKICGENLVIQYVLFLSKAKIKFEIFCFTKAA